VSRLPMADRRDQLVEAAIAIAAREGIEAATVRAVAVEAGVSAGVVHYCFSDKNELLTCMAQAITQLNTPAAPNAGPDGQNAEGQNPDGAERQADAGHTPSVEVGAATPTSEPPLHQVLSEFVASMWQSLESTRGYQLLTYELTVTALRSAELSGVAQSQYESSRAAASAVLETAARLAGVSWARPLDDLARVVVAAIDGASLAWLVDGDAEAAKRTLSATVDYLATQTG
jgi:AcrR family transcriptional regulator